MPSILTLPTGNLVVSVRITLRPGRDDELIELVRTAPARLLAATIREAMRSGVGHGLAVSEEDDDIDLSKLGYAEL